MINLRNEIRFGQKIDNIDTMSVYVKCVVRFNVNFDQSELWLSKQDQKKT